MTSETRKAHGLEDLLFPRLFQAFRIAVQPSKLIIALLALAAISLAGYVMDLSQSVVVGPGAQDQQSELDVFIAAKQAPCEAVDSHIARFGDNGQRTGVFSEMWRFGSARFHMALRELFELNFVSLLGHILDYFRAVQWAMSYHYVYCLVFAVIKLAVMSVAGGAICRLAALQFARGEKPGLVEALRFSARRFWSFFLAPVIPLAIVLCVGGVIFVVGLSGRIPHAGGLIVAVLAAVVLCLGVVAAVGLIGTVVGFNLMFPAVAYDGLDALDVVGRCFSYVFNSPWSMVLYSGICAVYGAICYGVVRLFAFLTLWVAHTGLRLGIGEQSRVLAAIWPEPTFMNLVGAASATPVGLMEKTAAAIVYVCLWVVAGLVVSVVITFYFSAYTIIYSLLRQKVDNAAIQDMYLELDDVSGNRL